MSEIELYAEISDTLLKNLNNLLDDLFNLNQLCKETEINNKKII